MTPEGLIPHQDRPGELNLNLILSSLENFTGLMVESEENRAVFFVLMNDVVNWPKCVISLAIYAILSAFELDLSKHEVGQVSQVVGD